MPTVREVLKGIETGPVGLWVAESVWAFNGILMFHLIAVTMVFGLIRLRTFPAAQDGPAKRS